MKIILAILIALEIKTLSPETSITDYMGTKHL